MSTLPLPDDSGLKEKLPKPMRYAAQVIWLLDPNDADMKQTADLLFAKRVAAGDSAKCQLVKGLKGDCNAANLPKSAEIRLCIVGHGVEERDDKNLLNFGIQTELSKLPLSAGKLLPYLVELISKMPEKRVRRISLQMCNSAGILNEIPPKDSFAQELVGMCPHLTTDITGRLGAVKLNYDSYPKSVMDQYLEPFPNPFHTVIDQLENEPQRSVLNARKKVRTFVDCGTYIFAPGKNPVLKPQYQE